MKILVKVTKEIIERSAYCGTDKCEGKGATHCGIAEALKELFPDVSVLYKIEDDHLILQAEAVIFLKKDNMILSTVQIDLPEEAFVFMRKFDSVEINTM